MKNSMSESFNLGSNLQIENVMNHYSNTKLSHFLCGECKNDNENWNHPVQSKNIMSGNLHTNIYKMRSMRYS